MFCLYILYQTGLLVAPARERGLKLILQPAPLSKTAGRSREGAWIEICAAAAAWRKPFVAPARERGLKSLLAMLLL